MSVRLALDSSRQPRVNADQSAARCRGQPCAARGGASAKRRVALVSTARPATRPATAGAEIPRRYPYSSCGLPLKPFRLAGAVVSAGLAAQHRHQRLLRRGEKIGTVWDTPLRSTPSFSSTDWPWNTSGARAMSLRARAARPPGTGRPPACCTKPVCRPRVPAGCDAGRRWPAPPDPGSQAVPSPSFRGRSAGRRCVCLGHSCILMHCREMRDKGKRASARRASAGGGPAFVSGWPMLKTWALRYAGLGFQARELREEQSLSRHAAFDRRAFGGLQYRRGRGQGYAARRRKDRGRRQEVAASPASVRAAQGPRSGCPGMPDAAISR